jgi:hypothetical protein
MLYTRTIHRIWLTCLKGSLLLGVSGSTKSRLVLIVLLTDTRLDLWAKVLLRSMMWIIRRPLLLLLAYLLCVLIGSCRLSTLVNFPNGCKKCLP